MKKILTRVIPVLVFIYLLIAACTYFLQERFIFPNTKLPADHVFHFNGKFKERNITAKDGKILSGLLFKADSSKGLIFYLHGIGNNLDRWGNYAKVYTDLGYDIFFLDYRGYGKSEGTISGEEQLYSDVQAAYDNLKISYSEDSIVVFGYSLGTGFAAMLAANNHPKMLVLQAPYYGFAYLAQHDHPNVISYASNLLPISMLRYQLRTYEFVAKTKSPIVIFHGNTDSTINIDHSYKLKALFKPGDTLIVLNKQGHNHFTENPEYLEELKRIFH